MGLGLGLLSSEYTRGPPPLTALPAAGLEAEAATEGEALDAPEEDGARPLCECIEPALSRHRSWLRSSAASAGYELEALFVGPLAGWLLCKLGAFCATRRVNRRRRGRYVAKRVHSAHARPALLG